MKCVNCSFHRIIPDPDPTDWFNADDEAIVCIKVLKDKDLSSVYQVDRCGFRPISVGDRPYQIKNVEQPKWCPLKMLLRDEILTKLLK